MTDAATTPEALSPETFDVEAWLDGTVYPEKKVEVFNRGDRLAEMSELLSFVAAQKEQRQFRTKQLTSIADEEADISEAMSEAQEQADAILDSLKGTGTIFHVRGLSTGERKVLNDTVARDLKPAPPKYEEIDGERVEIEPGHKGGEQHPDFSRHLANALVQRCIVSVTSASGAVDTTPQTTERVEMYRAKLHTSEWNRLSNACFDVNYYSYDIDKEVSLDFS